MTVNVRLAGVGSGFFALSVAVTSKLWAPGDSGLEGAWLAPGPEQGANAWESKRHRKVEPGSLEQNVKVGVLSGVGPEGPEVIVVCGRTVSTVNDRETIRLSFPGASIAFTEKVWAPFVSGAARVLARAGRERGGVVATDEGRAGLV